MLIRCVCAAERPVVDGRPVTIDWCPNCGTGATVPPPKRDVRGDGLFDDPQAGYGGNRLAAQQQWLFEAERRVAWIRRLARSGARVLEIGAATGEFVSVAEQHGYAVVGLETSRWAADAAQLLTRSVEASDLEDWRTRNPGTDFDVIAMFHVLEHFEEPGAFLHDLHSVAAPGARLVVEVPNGASSAARAQNGGWWAARLEDHHFHFTPDGMSAVLHSSGWNAVSLREVRMDVYARNAPPAAMRNVRDVIRPLVGRDRHSKDLLRVVARQR